MYEVITAIQKYVSNERPTSTYDISEIQKASGLATKDFKEVLATLEFQGLIKRLYGSNELVGLDINRNFPLKN